MTKIHRNRFPENYFGEKWGFREIPGKSGKLFGDPRNWKMGIPGNSGKLFGVPEITSPKSQNFFPEFDNCASLFYSLVSSAKRRAVIAPILVTQGAARRPSTWSGEVFARRRYFGNRTRCSRRCLPRCFMGALLTLAQASGMERLS